MQHSPTAQTKCILQQLKPHTRFARLGSGAEMLEIKAAWWETHLVRCVWISSLDSDARAAQTALKCSLPFPLLILYTCLGSCCPMPGCPRAQCQPGHPLGPQGQLQGAPSAVPTGPAPSRLLQPPIPARAAAFQRDGESSTPPGGSGNEGQGQRGHRSRGRAGAQPSTSPSLTFLRALRCRGRELAQAHSVYL